MTEFQRKTLKNTCIVLLKIIAGLVALAGIIFLLCWQPRIIMTIVAAGLALSCLIIPTVKDWKLRGRLTEDEYGIYGYYRERCRYLREETILAELVPWNDGLTMEQLQEIIRKAEGKS